MSITIKGYARTASGSKYLQQLCKHWDHKFEVEFTARQGLVRFPTATARLKADADGLLVTIETEAAQSVEPLKAVLSKHIDRFAFREAPLRIVWS